MDFIADGFLSWAGRIVLRSHDQNLGLHLGVSFTFSIASDDRDSPHCDDTDDYSWKIGPDNRLLELRNF
jgi:hypothetical protein